MCFQSETRINFVSCVVDLTVASRITAKLLSQYVSSVALSQQLHNDIVAGVCSTHENISSM